MLRSDKRAVRTAGLVVLAGLCLGGSTAAGQEGVSRQAHRMGRAPGKPAYLWLWYANGTSEPIDDGACTGYRPPAFRCTYGSSTADCQKKVQAILDDWYKGFNLVFTVTRPPTGDYNTVVITSESNWCPVPATDSPGSTVAGYAKLTCNDNQLQVAYAFDCGSSALACATVIAHEHAHWVGLQHTTSVTDIMNRYVLATVKGFDDQDNLIVDDKCGLLTQNSYQSMLAAFGAWPGGDKPSLFFALPDAGAADVAAPQERDAGSSGTPIGPGGPTIDSGPIGMIPGYDALVRPTVPIADAALAIPKSGGGCSHAGPRATAGSWLLPLLGLLVAWLTRARGRHLGRLARPAGEPLPCARPARRPSAVRARARR